MLARSHRFHGYGSLKGTYSRGFAIRTALLTARCQVQAPTRPYRVAVVVSKKVSKSAVVRNRIRRRIYEAVRRQHDSIQPGTDIILTVFNDQVATQPSAQLDQAVATVLKKITANSGENTN